MRLREHSSAILLWLAALLFALLAGVAIPLLSGGSPGPSATNWTPPPTPTTPLAVVRDTATPGPTAITQATATRPAPTAAPPASATATAMPTATPSAAPTAANTKALAAATTGPAATTAPQALTRILRGPANLRAGPGSSYTVMGTANDGDQFSVTGRSENSRWLRICCLAGAPVWVSVDLAQVPQVIDSLPVVP